MARIDLWDGDLGFLNDFWPAMSGDGDSLDLIWVGHDDGQRQRGETTDQAMASSVPWEIFKSWVALIILHAVSPIREYEESLRSTSDLLLTVVSSIPI